MQVQQRLEFDSDAHRKVYEYVERHGTTTDRELASGLDLEPDRLSTVLTDLEAETYLEERDGRYRIALDVGTEDSYEVEDVEVTIRPARQDDLSGLVGVMRQVSEEDEYLVGETVVDLLDHQEVVFRYNDVESRVFFVATVDDEVVGWVHLHAPNFAKLSHTAELTMGVLEEYRGRGIGSRLMERGLEWAETNGYEKVYQSLPATNQDAVRFLEDHRWETEAIRPAHYKIDDEYVAEQMMAVVLGGDATPRTG